MHRVSGIYNILLKPGICAMCYGLEMFGASWTLLPVYHSGPTLHSLSVACKKHRLLADLFGCGRANPKEAVIMTKTLAKNE